MSQSEELRNALNRRLRRIESPAAPALAEEPSPPPATPPTDTIFRSGWSRAPAIPPSMFIPPDLLVKEPTSSKHVLSHRSPEPRALDPVAPGAGSIMEGHLQKLSSGRLSGRWQRRYFHLSHTHLWYGAEGGGESKKSYDLRRVTSVRAQDPLDPGCKHFTLHLRGLEREVLELQADSATEMRQWVRKCSHLYTVPSGCCS